MDKVFDERVYISFMALGKKTLLAYRNYSTKKKALGINSVAISSSEYHINRIVKEANYILVNTIFQTQRQENIGRFFFYRIFTINTGDLVYGGYICDQSWCQLRAQCRFL